MAGIEDRTAEELLDESVQQLLAAVDVLREKKLTNPALILLYSAIDIVAWLAASEGATVEHAFTAWVKRYIRPEIKLGCTAADLYGARCGLVHAFSSESNLTRKGRARQVLYAWGDSDVSVLRQMLTLVRMRDYVAIQLETLVDAYRRGIETFRRDLQERPTLRATVHAKATKFLTVMPRGEAANLLQQGKEMLREASRRRRLR